MSILKTASAVGLAAALSAPVMAAEVSGNVTLASDYSFRGISQTTRDPAIQGGFDIETDFGLSIGTWASNVNFGDDTSMELDVYVGYGMEINDTMSWSVSFTRFEYPSEGDALDYNEVGGSFSFGDATVGLIFSNEYLAISDAQWFYPYIDYSVPTGDSFSLDVHLGINLADDPIFGTEDQYIDYSVSVTVPVSGVDLGLAIVGSDLDEPNCGNVCEARLVASISKSL